MKEGNRRSVYVKIVGTRREVFFPPLLAIGEGDVSRDEKKRANYLSQQLASYNPHEEAHTRDHKLLLLGIYSIQS